MTREEAIEVYHGLINEKIKAAFEFFAPELRESDDERIRNGLIQLLTVASAAYLDEATGIKKDSFLAYLKKKKQGFIDDICSKAGIAQPFLDGNQWCILKGDNIQAGVVGFGDTKEDALANFIKDVPIPQNEPIPITPEILEKNGLRKLITFGTEKWVCDKFRLNVYDSGETWRFCAYTNKNEDSVIYIRFVHELQLALRVCGIEKEIMI